MQLPVRFHAAIVAASPSGGYCAELQVKTTNDQIITVWSDTFSDPLTALQALTTYYGEAQS